MEKTELCLDGQVPPRPAQSDPPAEGAGQLGQCSVPAHLMTPQLHTPRHPNHEDSFHPQRPRLHTLRQPSRPHLGPPATSQWLEEITRTMMIIVEVEAGKGASRRHIPPGHTLLFSTATANRARRYANLQSVTHHSLGLKNQS